MSEPRYFKVYDGEERTWRVFDTGVEDHVRESNGQPLYVQMDADVDAVVEFLNLRDGMRVESRAPGQPRMDWNNRDSLIRWIAWNDRNASVTDEDSAAEGLDPLTLDEARHIVFETFFGPGCNYDQSLPVRLTGV